MRSLVLPDGSIALTVVDPSGVEIVVVKRPKTFEAVPAVPLEIEAPFAFYIPHTARHPETIAGSPANATWVDVSSSNIAYYAAMSEWWANGETFMILEHDVVCRPDVIEEADACPELWCVWQYAPVCPCGNPDCREAWRNMLGCTRFRAEIMAKAPDAMDFPADNWDWHNMCDGVGNNLRAAGFTHHWHEPPVHHHCETGKG